MITSTTPGSWRALQDETARILQECGFTVKVERKTPIVRGVAEIDVYAEEMVKGRRYAILCECKHWRAKVPQTVIHAFRTVVADSGANVGYIISSAGFQAGAYSAAELTNVRLVSWGEFQAEFEQSWLEHYLVPTVTDQCDLLITYTEPLLPAGFRDLNEQDQRRFLTLKQEHEPFGWLMMSFTQYARMIIKKPPPKLPLRPRLTRQEWVGSIPSKVLDAAGYREFLDAALAHSDAVVQLFQTALKHGEL